MRLDVGNFVDLTLVETTVDNVKVDDDAGDPGGAHEADANGSIVEESTFGPVGVSADPSTAATGGTTDSEYTVTSSGIEEVTVGVAPEARGEDDDGVDSERLEREGDEGKDGDDIL